MTATDQVPSVTFVGHDASRTGAPKVLASALRWVEGNAADGTDRRLVLLDGGPMLEEFRRILPTRVLGPSARQASRSVDAARSIGLPQRSTAVLTGAASLLATMGSAPTDVVVASTLVSLPHASRLAARKRPNRARLVCYVCELDGVAARVLPDLELRDTLVGDVDRWIATGSAVAEMLTDRWGVRSGSVTTVDPWIDPPGGGFGAHGGGDAFPTDRSTVLTVGSRTHRKGPERFVDLMSILTSHPSRPVGVWVGGSDHSSVGREMLDDVRRSVDPGSIRLVSEVDDTAPIVSAAHVAVSTAIEDPFPLVVLEAAAAGVPVAAFDSGGVRDALSAVDQADALVPVDDVIGLARVVARLLDDPQERIRRGEALSRWVRSTHLTEHLVPLWWRAVLE